MRCKSRLGAALLGAMLLAGHVWSDDAPDDRGADPVASEYFRDVPPDLTGDRHVDVLDLIELVMHWGECKGCAADLDGNGFVDATDLTILLFNWG